MLKPPNLSDIIKLLPPLISAVAVTVAMAGNILAISGPLIGALSLNATLVVGCTAVYFFSLAYLALSRLSHLQIPATNFVKRITPHWVTGGFYSSLLFLAGLLLVQFLSIGPDTHLRFASSSIAIWILILLTILWFLIDDRWNFSLFWLVVSVGLVTATVAFLSPTVEFLNNFGSNQVAMTLVVSLLPIPLLKLRPFLELILSLIIFLSILGIGARAPVLAALVWFGVWGIFRVGKNVVNRQAPLLTALFFLVLNLAAPSQLRTRVSAIGDQAIILTTESGPVLTLSTSGRIDVWRHLLDQLDLAGFLVGRGTGASRLEVTTKYGWDHPHNMYIQILYDNGIIGLFLLLGFAVSLVIVSQKSGADSESRYLLLATVIVSGLLSFFDNFLASAISPLAAGAFIGHSLRRIYTGTVRRHFPKNP